MRPFKTDGPIGSEVAGFLRSLPIAKLPPGTTQSERMIEMYGQENVALAKALGHERRLVDELLATLKDWDRMVLVIESAVRNSDPGHYETILDLIKRTMAQVKKVEGGA